MDRVPNEPFETESRRVHQQTARLRYTHAPLITFRQQCDNGAMNTKMAQLMFRIFNAAYRTVAAVFALRCPSLFAFTYGCAASYSSGRLF